MSVHTAPRRGVIARWVTELTLGMRLSVAGGRSGRVRLAMISLGVGLGVAMLFVAATIPTLVGARDARIAARAEDKSLDLPRGDDTLLIAEANSEYRDHWIHGRLVQLEGGRAPLPPGVDRHPAPGEMLASPALSRLLAGDDGALLRDRWDAKVVGTIGPAGLTGPGEYAFYLGTDRLDDSSRAIRIRSFGFQHPDSDPGTPPLLLLLAVVGIVVLLLPVAIFVATAVRFGGESRDRQLAALRLVGADAAMTRRIAAGETLIGGLLGLLVGGLLYVAIGLLAGGSGSGDLSFYSADYRPVPLLATAIVVLVPLGAVLVTMSALRRVVVEPLGVARLSGERRRRLWWRLVLPVVGIALLAPLKRSYLVQGSGFEYQAMAGVTALLVGVALLLPWVVEAAVRRLRGGGVSWELAVRRLQLDSGTAVRAVSGIAVSVAGVIALQGLLAATQAAFTVDTGRSTDQFQAEVRSNSNASVEQWRTALQQTPGVRAVGTLTSWQADPAGSADPSEESTRLSVGDCAALRQEARIDACADGDVFVVDADPRPGSAYEIAGAHESVGMTPGETEPARRWELPSTVRRVAAHPDPLLRAATGTILATPGAVRGLEPGNGSNYLYVGFDTADPDALDRVRNAALGTDPTAWIRVIENQSVADVLLDIRRALLGGALGLLLLIGASMLVNVAEQLRERRRLLAVLVAFGTRRATLTGSVVYQVAIPVVLGLALAVATGTALSTALQATVGAPISFDWWGIGAAAGAAALTVLITSTASLPLLWRLTRPGGLRSE